MKKKKLGLILALGITAGILIYGILDLKSDHSSAPKTNRGTQDTFDKEKFSTSAPSSLWVVVNKGRKLPADYKPSKLITPNVRLRFAATSDEMKLQAEAAAALETLFAGAQAAGHRLLLVSGYRPYASQQAIYERNVKTYGLSEAEMTSARAGHSEHQTGLAVDIGNASRTCELEKCFSDSAEGSWLALKAHKYGFVLRYHQGVSAITGYDFEPWHFRYVGTELALQIHSSGQTLEQFFGLPNSTSYGTSPVPLGE